MMAWHWGMVVNGHISQHSRLLSAFLFPAYFCYGYVLRYISLSYVYLFLSCFVLKEKGGR